MAMDGKTFKPMSVNDIRIKRMGSASHNAYKAFRDLETFLGTYHNTQEVTRELHDILHSLERTYKALEIYHSRMQK